MAHWSQELSFRGDRYVPPSSRYIRSGTRFYTEDKLITFETYKRRVHRVNQEDKWMEIIKPFEYRPDLAAKEIFGTPDFWWALMEHNGMKDIMEFKAGKNIKIPSDFLS